MAGDCLDRDNVERKDSNMSTESNDQERMRVDSESSSSNDGFDVCFPKTERDYSYIDNFIIFQTLEPLDFDDIARYVDLGKR